MDTKAKFDFKLFERLIFKARGENLSGKRTTISKEFEDMINEYIRLVLNKHNLPLWFSLDRKVLIARINRKFKENIPFVEVSSSDELLSQDLEHIISTEIKKNIERQQEFKIKLEFTDNKTKYIQKMPRIPLKDEVIVYDEKEYTIASVKWDITNGDTILKLI